MFARKVPVDSTGNLVVGEGIETCLAARQMGMKPVWALGSVGAIGRLPVGSKVDDDYSWGGGRSQREYGRWWQKAVECALLCPMSIRRI